MTNCEKAHIIYQRASNKLGGHEIAVLRRVMETGKSPKEIERVASGNHLHDQPFERICTEFAHLLTTPKP